MGLIASAAALWPGTEPTSTASSTIVEAPTTEPLPAGKTDTATLDPAPTPVRLVAVHGPPQGEKVTDGEGNILYRYEHDQPGVSTCFGSCEAVWPPVLTTGEPQVTGIDPTLVGTLRRPDGTLQVTLRGWPLYRHAQVS